MTDELEAAVAFVRALPACVTSPAGTGKTHLLSATVAQLAASGGRVLVLTHTNAGVHAIQKRLKEFGVTKSARVSTLSSFAFLLTRSYPQIGGLKVSPVPDWSKSAAYITAAEKIARSTAISEAISETFTHVLVDEYQDCSEGQHAFVCALADSIPSTGILGDPMQAIFGFRDTKLVEWDVAVARFPEMKTNPKPWRWIGHNEDLGEWLLRVRESLKPGVTIDFARIRLPSGVEFRSSAGDYRALAKAALTSRPAGDTVLIVSTWKGAIRKVASDLNGAFTVMEEIAGDFMAERLLELATLTPSRYASWLLNLTKRCCCGHKDLNETVRNRLAKNATVRDLDRHGLDEALAAFDVVVDNPTYATLALAMDSIPKSSALKLHSHEAWYDIQTAIRGSAAQGSDPAVLIAELGRARDRIRHQGRRHRNRLVSRTVLVKGLEYDHVVIADISQITDVNNLYVALTRARKSITILGGSSIINVTKT